MKFTKFIKNYLLILILILIIFLLFFPITTEYSNNYKIYHSIIDLGFADYGVFAALFVGLLSFLATIYTNDKNLNLMRLSYLPEENLTLIINIENELLYNNLSKNLSGYDQILVFIKLLKLFMKYENAFRLTFPKLHRDIMKFFTKDAVFERNSEIFEKNAQIIITDIKLSILNEIRENKKERKLKDSKFCNDKTKFYNINSETTLEINTDNLKKYLENINGIKSKECAFRKFFEMNEFIKTFIENLENETEKIRNV